MARSRGRIAWLVLCAGILATREAGASDSDSSYADSALSASTAAVWTPPSPVHAARAWESAVRLPGRVLSLPLVGLGVLTRRGATYAEEVDEPGRVRSLFVHLRDRGFEPGPASLGDNAGPGGKLGWAPQGLDHRVLLELGASTNLSHRERITAFEGPVGAMYTVDWRPQERWYGPGLATTTAGLSDYAVHERSAKLLLAWGWQRMDSLKVAPSQPPMFADGIRVRGPRHRTWVTGWAGPRTLAMSRGRSPKLSSFEVVHPLEAAGSFDRDAGHFVYGAGISHDARFGRPHWSRGWRASLEGERDDKALHPLMLGATRGDVRSFTRLVYRAEAATSFGRDPRTLRLSLRAVDQRADATGGTMLIADLQPLGGSAGLSGYDSGRFRDMDLALARLSYIFPLLKNFEFDMHAETGGVYPGLTLLRAETLRTSGGVALRVRGDSSMLGALGCDWSRETARFWLSLGGIE